MMESAQENGIENPFLAKSSIIRTPISKGSVSKLDIGRDIEKVDSFSASHTLTRTPLNEFLSPNRVIKRQWVDKTEESTSIFPDNIARTPIIKRKIVPKEQGNEEKAKMIPQFKDVSFQRQNEEKLPRTPISGKDNPAVSPKRVHGEKLARTPISLRPNDGPTTVKRMEEAQTEESPCVTQASAGTTIPIGAPHDELFLRHAREMKRGTELQVRLQKVGCLLKSAEEQHEQLCIQTEKVEKQFNDMKLGFQNAVGSISSIIPNRTTQLEINSVQALEECKRMLEHELNQVEKQKDNEMRTLIDKEKSVENEGRHVDDTLRSTAFEIDLVKSRLDNQGDALKLVLEDLKTRKATADHQKLLALQQDRAGLQSARNERAVLEIKREKFVQDRQRVREDTHPEFERLCKRVRLYCKRNDLLENSTKFLGL